MSGSQMDNPLNMIDLSGMFSIWFHRFHVNIYLSKAESKAIPGTYGMLIAGALAAALAPAGAWAAFAGGAIMLVFKQMSQAMVDHKVSQGLRLMIIVYPGWLRTRWVKQ